jgi:hypothetical protein
MLNRSPVVFALFSLTAAAQDVSGTFSGAFTGFDSYGVATVHMDLSLQCSLSCPSSAPDLHFGYGANATAMVAAPMLWPNGVSVSIVDAATGQASWDTHAPAGSNFTATVKGASCWCGNTTGEGGFIDLTTPTIQVPPWFNVLAKPVTVGRDPLIILNATPVAGELVQVHISGGGVDFTHSYSAADFKTETSGDVSAKSIEVPLTFTAAGMVTATASVGDGPMQVQTLSVVGSGSTGGGNPGPADAGDASGPSGGPEGGGGCAAAPGLFPLAVALLAIRLRVRR